MRVGGAESSAERRPAAWDLIVYGGRWEMGGRQFLILLLAAFSAPTRGTWSERGLGEYSHPGKQQDGGSWAVPGAARVCPGPPAR